MPFLTHFVETRLAASTRLQVLNEGLQQGHKIHVIT